MIHKLKTSIFSTSGSVILAAAGILGIMALPLLRGQVFVLNDLGTCYLPFRSFYAKCLSLHESFDWCPDVFCGYYLQGDGAAAMYHPLHLLLYGLLPLGVAFNLEMLLNYPFMFAGMFLFLRQWSLRRDAALFGAFTFTFSGFNLLHFFHLSAVAIVAHIPWLLLAIHTLLRDVVPRRLALAALGVGFLTASEILLGYPQYVWFSSLVEVLYALFLTLVDRRTGCLRRLGFLAFAKLSGILAGCIQLIPTWEALKDSVRAQPTASFRAMGSLNPANLVQLVAPYLFKSRFVTTTTKYFDADMHESGLYNGAMVTVLLMWLWIRRKQLGDKSPLSWAAVCLGVMALLLAFGGHTFLFRLTSMLPLINVFRMPCRYIVLFQFATAVLAALAFEDLARFRASGERLHARQLVVLALPFCASVLVSLAARVPSHVAPSHALDPYLASPDLIGAGPALIGGALVLVLLAMRGRSLPLLAIVLFTALDQGSYGLSFVWHKPPTNIASFVGARSVPPRSGGYRVLIKEPCFDNLRIMNGLHLVNGYVSLRPSVQLDYDKTTSQRLAGAGWIIEDKYQAKWSRVPDALPRARLLVQARRSSAPSQDIEEIDVATTALLDDDVELPTGTPGECRILNDRPGNIVIETVAASRQVLVLGERYHHGWRVSVDGMSRPARRVNGDFLGLIVEPGRHEVSFRFDPESLRVGKMLTVMGAGFLLFVSTIAHGFASRRFEVTGSVSIPA